MKSSSTKSHPPWLPVPFFLVFCLHVIATAESSRVAASAGAFRRKLDDIAGSIDIDCGLPTGATYTDPITEIPYIADDAYITTGVNSEISSIHISDDLPVPLRTLRSFPEGDRNCYSMRPPEGRDKIYLIRATFLYGNYDDNDRLPEFDVFVGVNRWASLRHFHNSTYTSVSGAPLVLYERLDFGSATGEIIRYNDDAYDRMCFELNTREATLDFYIYMHFAELEALQEGESRVFDISLNGIVLRRNVVPIYLHSTTITSPQSVRGSKLNFLLSKSMNSTHPPILNVDAIEDIKSTYGVQKGWQGDPCAPIHPWNGLNCSNNGYRPYRIISLNLSSSGLTGQIPISLSNLHMLEHLDLSNNSISGEVPLFLSELPSLRNLGGNQLSGPVPSSFIEKSNNGSLILSLHGNPKLCTQSPCKKKKSSIFVPVIATIVPLFVITLAFLILWKYKRSSKRIGKSHGALGSGMKLESREFTYQEIIRITDNFRTIIGKGGFGVVYHGHLDDGTRTEVAIKLLSPSATHGSIQFQTEYMAGGDLEKYISDCSRRVLSWKERLQIALDAAQGLEYLHIGCKPPIVHRDVKTSNILLNDKMQAKIADFGLSKLFPVESQSYLSTRVVGTVGYLDPELTEKSDVYSFGIVLLQLITGRPAIIVGHNENTHIGNWARPLIAKGDLRNLVDPRLLGNFDTNSAWKLLEVSISCIRSISIQRPMMNHVVSELKECLDAEVANEESARVNEDGEVEEEFNNDSFAMSSSTKGVELEQGPEAR
ncbi:unnamed protein product [Linum tenue]|uniref:non-specific serine/threonine protein kinase n=1 Tax=Linum tenue TaxID=586396 RepID=A0AAV0I6R6_9ROSI|nr:unnamed protein product [Linum tenue]